ncbi:arginine/serine-rich protein 1-like [Cynocephalus volans]|uniref:arginine/serine-rich protein 1-like n=1 Tax=Cynocephalus volans TaxID=110931 RepID=UPI002FCAD48C
MSNYVKDKCPSSSQSNPLSMSRSGQPSLQFGSSSNSRSSRSNPRLWRRSWSSSRNRPQRRSRSRSRSRRHHERKYRGFLPSNRSRSHSRRHREWRCELSRRYYRSPPYRARSRPRSRTRLHSPGGSYHRRASAITRERRHYCFGRKVYPEEHRRRRKRSRTRSRSRTPFRLSEKDRKELLEIAKANAAKALGTTDIDLPAGLGDVPAAKETSRRTAVPNNVAKVKLWEKLTEDGTKTCSEKSSPKRSIAFSSKDSVATPIQKSAKAVAEETSSGSPKTDQEKRPRGLWIPV